MAATSMPRIPQPELCWLTGQRAQPRLGVRGFGCSMVMSAGIIRKVMVSHRHAGLIRS